MPFTNKAITNMKMHHLNTSTLITTAFIALIIPITVIAARYQTNNQSKASPSTPTAFPPFVSTPANYPPTFLPFNVDPLYTNAQYQFSIIANDKDEQDILHVTAAGLPHGFTLSGCTHAANPGSGTSVTCSLSGQPATSGVYEISILATDKMGHSGTIKRELIVYNWYQRLPFLK
jgi:hypothetical protein